MKSLFANVSSFGMLEILRVYGYYDEPLMFSCQDAKGAKYLLFRQADEKATWLAVEISGNRLNKLENGHVEMRFPFLHPENGLVYLITGSGEVYPVSLLSPESITDDMLPYAGEYLKRESEDSRLTIQDTEKQSRESKKKFLESAGKIDVDEATVRKLREASLS